MISKKMEDAPNYRPSPYPDKNCGNCIHGGDGYCSLFSGNYLKSWICTSWEDIEAKHEKHVPPAEVSYNAARGLQLHKDAADGERSDDPAKTAVMRGLAVGRPMHLNEIKAMHDHFEAAHHPAPGDKAARQIHLGLGGQAGRSWAKRVKSLYDGDDMVAKDHVQVLGEISKLDDEKHYVFGLASVVQENGRTVVDRQQDTMTQEELEKMAYNYVLDCRDGAVMHDPSTIGTGKLIESMVLTPEKARALGCTFNKVGWWIGLHITDPDVWAKVKDGTYKFFSIHGSGERDDIPDHEAKRMITVEQS